MIVNDAEGRNNLWRPNFCLTGIATCKQNNMAVLLYARSYKLNMRGVRTLEKLQKGALNNAWEFSTRPKVSVLLPGQDPVPSWYKLVPDYKEPEDLTVFEGDGTTFRGRPLTDSNFPHVHIYP